MKGSAQLIDTPPRTLALAHCPGSDWSSAVKQCSAADLRAVGDTSGYTGWPHRDAAPQPGAVRTQTDLVIPRRYLIRCAPLLLW